MNQALQYKDDLELDLQSYQNDSDRVDTAIQGMESIMQTRDILTDENTTLDATSLRLAEQSVECFLKLSRIGSPSNRIIPSNESFGRNYDITQATLESIGEGIKNVFLSIINAIRKAFDWMWGLIKRLFGRGKDHEETAAKLTAEAEEVKEKVKTMSEEEKKSAPFPRDADGWFTKVTLDRPAVLKKLVTSKGLMTQEHLNQYMGELARVFQLQPKNVNRAMQVMNGAKPDAQHYEVPFHAAQSDELKKQVSRDKDAKVFASLEFGSGEYIYIVVPALRIQGNMDERDFAKASIAWADGLTVGKATVGRAPELDKFRVLEGDYASGDKLLEMIKMLNKFLMSKTDELKTFQGAKERFLKEFEALIKKKGVGLFSSNEMKAERDEMTYYLKYFKKVMDQPAVFYYGEIEGIITAIENLAAYVMAFNRRNGNHVELKADEEPKSNPREDDVSRRQRVIQDA
ncbi:MAG TPA: hypothetical protein VF905_11985, partial [Nitrospirota bacterium]